MSTSTLTASLVVSGVAVPAESVRLTIDESWAPYVQVEVTVPWTTARAAALSPTGVSPAPRAVLHLARSWGDPGTLADLTAEWAGHPVSDLTAAWAGLTVGDLTVLWGTPWTTPAIPSQELIADLTVRTVRVGVRAATMTVTLTSDEALAQDTRINRTVLATDLRSRVVELLATASLTVSPDDLAAIPSTAVAPGWVYPTQSVWEIVQDLCTAVGVRVWCDEARRWHSASTAITIPGTTVLASVTDLTITDDRDGGWADTLYRCYTAQVTDEDGNTENRTWVWTSSPTLEPAPGQRSVTVTTDLGAVSHTAWPPADSYEEARARWLRLASLATTIEVTAVADLTIRPGTLVATAAPLPVVSGIASAITWALPADTVTITTRKAI